MSSLVKFEDICVGMSSTFVKTIFDKDILEFSEVTGDFNPIHLDDDFAKNTIFKIKGCS